MVLTNLKTPKYNLNYPLIRYITWFICYDFDGVDE
jgi:hypothetical protein